MAERIISGRKFRTVGDSYVAGEAGELGTTNDGATPGEQYAPHGTTVTAEPNVGNGGNYVDPGTIGGAAPDAPGPVKRGRGRPRGSGGAGGSGSSSSTKRAATSKATDSLGSLLFSVHMMGAMFAKTPELQLSEAEAKQLADAVQRVTELYNVAIVDEKTLAWINLAMTAGAIYGTRFVAVSVNRSKKKAGPVVMPSRAVPVDFTANGVV